MNSESNNSNTTSQQTSQSSERSSQTNNVEDQQMINAFRFLMRNIILMASSAQQEDEEWESDDEDHEEQASQNRAQIQVFMINLNVNIANPTSSHSPLAKEKVDRLVEQSQFVCNSPKENPCSICQEEYKLEDTLLKLGCEHEFHGKCLMPWLKMQNTCPMCRKVIE